GLGELLLESANDALLQRLSCEPEVRAVVDLLLAQAKQPALPELLLYWTNLVHDEEGADHWPISKQLWEVLGQRRTSSDS
ncbi:hypothetical protein K7W42_11045, partial [Deinococcus sp. HMF7604]|uniref:hypothetical protein n=1 Tax=Deinococcus betulae TaxID=2873312 RepID=UPI001CCA64BB